MSELRIKNLGLAAYLKMKGEPLLRIEDKGFIFETSKTESEWRIEYSNSESSAHDSEVLLLKRLGKG